MAEVTAARAGAEVERGDAVGQHGGVGPFSGGGPFGGVARFGGGGAFRSARLVDGVALSGCSGAFGSAWLVGLAWLVGWARLVGCGRLMGIGGPAGPDVMQAHFPGPVHVIAVERHRSPLPGRGPHSDSDLRRCLPGGGGVPGAEHLPVVAPGGVDRVQGNDAGRVDHEQPAQQRRGHRAHSARSAGTVGGGTRAGVVSGLRARPAPR